MSDSHQTAAINPGPGVSATIETTYPETGLYPAPSRYSYERRSEVIPLDRLREAYLHLTNRCRGGCKHCYASSSPAIDDDELSTEQWTEVLDQLTDLGTQNFVLLGGDPFERPDLLDLVDYAAGRLGANLRIFYARHIDPSMAARLAGCGHGRLAMVASLEGPDAQSHDFIRKRGSFAKIIAGVRNLMAVGLVPVVNTVVTSTNLPLLPRMAEFLDSLGIARWHLLLPHHRGYICQRPGLIPQAQELAAHLLDLRTSVSHLNLWIDNFAAWESRLGGGYDLCNAGYNLIAVAQDGGVYACPATVGDDRFRCGNVRESSIRKIWEQSAGMGEIRDASLANRLACRSCEIAGVCGGECIAQAYYHAEATAGTGSLSAAYPYCEAVGTMLKSMLANVAPSPVKGIHYIECT